MRFDACFFALLLFSSLLFPSLPTIMHALNGEREKSEGSSDRGFGL